MKFFVYGGVVLLVVPFQAVIIPQFAIGGIVPDAILLTVVLVRLWRGALEAVVLGLVLGFAQDLVSGSMLWVNFMTKPCRRIPPRWRISAPCAALTSAP